MNEEVNIQEPTNPDAGVQEDNPPGAELSVPSGEVDAVAPKAEEAKEESPIKVAYQVGIRENGEFVFLIMGSQPGLVEILGAHEYASKKIQLLYDRSQVEGQHSINVQFNILNQKFNKTLETLNDLLNKLSGVSPTEESRKKTINPNPGKNNL